MAALGWLAPGSVNEGFLMKVSIITPVLNERRLDRALDSVLAQRLDHALETIVIDAGSTDATQDILARYRQRLSLVVSEPDRGIYDGMNKGIGAASGDVIGILNADDCYGDDQVLQDVMDAFGREPDTQVVYGNIAVINRRGKIVRYWKSGPHREFKWRLGWRPPHPAFFVRREAYERHGAFNLAFNIASDYELQLRLLLKHRVRSSYLDRTLVRMAPGGISNRSLRHVVTHNLDVRRAWSHHRLRGGQLVPLLKPLLTIRQLVRAPFMYGGFNDARSLG